jgi:uncharacterized membrane protein YedE/YeeE
MSVAELPAPPAVEEEPTPSAAGLVPYLLAGIWFGIVLTRAEVVSWFRIQEMFRFHSPRMYLIIGSAVATASLSLAVLRRLGLHTVHGGSIAVQPKLLGRGYRYWIGGSVFGIGWALTGACPGALFSLVGAGYPVLLVSVACALVGTWAYGVLRPRLPHY